MSWTDIAGLLAVALFIAGVVMSAIRTVRRCRRQALVDDDAGELPRDRRYTVEGSRRLRPSSSGPEELGP